MAKIESNGSVVGFSGCTDTTRIQSQHSMFWDV